MAYSLTFRDAIDHLRQWSGGNVQHELDARNAVLSAYRVVTQHRQWRYLVGQYRLYLQAPYSTGTIVYDQTGGAHEREVTLSSGTWPTWAGSAEILIGSVVSRVQQRVSNSVITLDETINPEADIASGTSYQLFQLRYTLPSDFVSCDEHMLESAWSLAYVPPREWLNLMRWARPSGGPSRFSILGDPENLFRHTVMFDSAPATALTNDFFYQRRPRELTYSGYDSRDTVGTLAISSSGTTVTGTSTTFESGMVGSIIRFGTSSRAPGPRAGPDPYAMERTIQTYTSATSLEVSTAAGAAYSGVKYVISDPIDIAENMTEAFLRGCEYELAKRRNTKDLERTSRLFQEALIRCAGADQAYYGPRAVGDAGIPFRRLADIPLDANY